MSDYIDRSVILKEIEDQLDDLRKKLSDPGMDCVRGASLYTLGNAFAFVRDVIKRIPAAEPADHPQLHWHTITSRQMTEEEQEYYDTQYGTELIEGVPDDCEDCLVKSFAVCAFDIFCDDSFTCYWESGDAVEAGQKWISINELEAYLDSMEPQPASPAMADRSAAHPAGEYADNPTTPVFESAT